MKNDFEQLVCRWRDLADKCDQELQRASVPNSGLVLAKDERTAYEQSARTYRKCADELAGTGVKDRCYVCGSTHDVRMAPEWLTGLGKPWCFDCFVAWYDYGITDLEAVRTKSLELQFEARKSRQSPAAPSDKKES